ncbi:MULTISPECIES: hypothetical protein [unclassified Massilia]|nr:MULTISPECIES: hypothetical protein [unclassified Massilia]MBD8532922.1 hypothetical protein [Massilia sp. CFBP 13647]MBD8676314.1 hypothetical protein [Massilia sp. CFBP 13721]
MHAITLTSYGNQPENTLRSKVRILLDEILFALELSNRAYYQGINRF